MPNLVLPRVQAIVLCDGVKESDLEVDVFQLSGVRTYLEFRSFPVSHPRLCVFMQMTGHQGDVECRVEINRVAADDVIYQTPAKRISFDDPRKSSRWCFACAIVFSPYLAYITCRCSMSAN